MSTVLAPQDALAEIKREIEEAASAGWMPPDVRSARLLEFRVDLVDLIGLIDTYVGDNANEQTPDGVLKLRENADLRAEMLRRELATPEALDEAFLYDHDTLDDLAELGLLEETAAQVEEVYEELVEAFDLAGWTERLHPRGRGGQFINKLGGLDFLQGKGVRAPAHDLTGGTRAPKLSGRKRRGAKKAAAKITAARTAEKALPQEEKQKLYSERHTKVESKVAEKVSQARSSGKLTEAEAHFNDAGKVSQRTLLAYATDAASQPTTADLYSKRDPATGERVWDESRRALHEQIIGAYLKKRKIGEDGRETLDFSPSAPDLVPHPEGPQVLFSGGGYAAGKGSALKIKAAQGETPPDAFTLDPDEIKALLPEFQAMIGTDPEANLHTYEEAWAIAQEIQARAQERKLNMIVDGISDTSPDEMLKRAKSFTDRGYKAHAMYVNLPTDEAIRRAQNRALTAEKDSDRRMIPEIIMRSVHRDVAATVPSLMNELAQGGKYNDVPLDVSVWDNNVPRGEPPIQVATQLGGQPMEIHDQPLWDQFRQKGSEEILHVDRPAVSDAISERAKKLGQ